MISSATRLSRLLDADGRPTTEAVHRYTHGDCWLLAFYLSQELDAPLVAVADRAHTSFWDHVLVDLGRERLLDVTGVSTREETLARWSWRVGGPLRFWELGRFTSLTEYLRVLDNVERPYDYISEECEHDAQAVAGALAQTYRSTWSGVTESRPLS